jgi:DNA-directed RNA polymerase subunit F
MTPRDRSIVPRGRGSLARVEGPLADSAIVPDLVDVSAFAAQLERYRESGNFITRWINSRLSTAQSSQEAQMIQGFAKQWQAIQTYYDGVAGAFEAAYKAERAQGKLARVHIENRRDLQLAEMEAQSSIGRGYFESFTLQAEELKEKLLSTEARQRELAVRIQENELKLQRLNKEIREEQRPTRRPARRRRWDPKETAERIASTVDDMGRALRHVDQLFRQSDPEMADDVKQEIRELFRQGMRHLNGQHGEEDDSEEGGDEDGAGSYSYLEEIDDR